MIKELKGKLLVVANNTWNIYNFRMHILNKFLQEGWEIFVVARPDEYFRYLQGIPNVHFIPLNEIYRTGKSPVQDFRFLNELVGIYKKVQPDLAIHYTVKPNIYGGIAAQWVGIPYIGIITGLGYPFIHNGWLKKLTSLLYSIGLRKAKFTVFENEEDPVLFTKLGILNSHKVISLKGCGIDTTYFSPRPKTRKDKRFIFTYIGRLLYDKGLQEFVDAAGMIRKKYPSAEFWIVGAPDPENPASVSFDKLTEWVFSQQITYFGNAKDVRPFIANSDCIVCPSYREGNPKVLQEGMAMGIPIITTQTAGCRETVDDGEQGFLVEAQSTEALYEGMVRMLSMDELEMQIMGHKGIIKATEVFEANIIASQVFEISMAAVNGSQSILKKLPVSQQVRTNAS